MTLELSMTAWRLHAFKPTELSFSCNSVGNQQSLQIITVLKTFKYLNSSYLCCFFLFQFPVIVINCTLVRNIVLYLSIYLWMIPQLILSGFLEKLKLKDFCVCIIFPIEIVILETVIIRSTIVATLCTYQAEKTPL